MWNLKIMIQMNLFTKQKQTLRLRKQTYGYQRGRWVRNKLGVWDQQIQNTIYKIDNQKGFTVQHRELYSIPCNNLYKIIMEKSLKKSVYKKYITEFTLLYTCNSVNQPIGNGWFTRLKQ